MLIMLIITKVCNTLFSVLLISRGRTWGKTLRYVFTTRSIVVCFPASSFGYPCLFLNDVTSKVQAVKSWRNLENRRSRVVPSRRIYIYIMSCVCARVYHRGYVFSIPFLALNRYWRKEGSILGHFLINEGWAPARLIWRSTLRKREGIDRSAGPFFSALSRFFSRCIFLLLFVLYARIDWCVNVLRSFLLKFGNNSIAGLRRKGHVSNFVIFVTG